MVNAAGCGAWDSGLVEDKVGWDRVACSLSSVSVVVVKLTYLSQCKHETSCCARLANICV